MLKILVTWSSQSTSGERNLFSILHLHEGIGLAFIIGRHVVSFPNGQFINNVIMHCHALKPLESWGDVTAMMSKRKNTLCMMEYIKWTAKT
jgi:hypothetical protein